MIAILLALEIDVARICARYETHTPPAARSVNVRCDDEQFCFLTQAMKFANGDGVKRDYEAAEYFLCKAAEEVAPAEHEGMLEHLQQMKARRTAEPLDYCDHVTSGYGSSYCSGVVYDREMPKIEARLKKIRTNAKLDPLRKRAEAFLRAESERIGYDVRHGTGYSAIVLAHELESTRRFAGLLESLSTKRAPMVTPAEAKTSDAELNAVYRTMMNELFDEDPDDELDPKTFLRDAQRAWIAYRDAFADYYAERWRGTATADVLRREVITRLTRDRIAQLQEAI